MRRRTEIGQSGVVMILFTFTMLGMAVLMLDAGRWYVQKHNLQGAADAGALAGVRMLPDTVAADSTAREYAGKQSAQDNPTVDDVVIDENASSIRVVLSTTGDTFFGTILSVVAPTIDVDATAGTVSPSAMSRMLPFAFLDEAYTLEDNYPVKTHEKAFGNGGVISPPAGDECTTTHGGDDYGSIIETSLNGGMDACAVPVGDTISTFPGNIQGPTKSGFDTRIGDNTQALDDVFAYDEDLGRWLVLDPDSPRIGVAVVLTGTDGVAAWPTGAKDMVVVRYLLCYIGKTDAPPNYPPYTDGGKTVWLTPLATILPEEFDATFGPGDPSSDAPVSWALTE